MPKIVKPGADPKAIRAKIAARKKERAKRNAAITDAYDLPDNVRPINPVRTAAALMQARTGTIDTSNDPTLLETIEWVMKKAMLGFTYQQIQMLSEDELGIRVTVAKARRYVGREMAKRKDPLVREIRKREDMRLDYLMTKLETKVEEGDVQAIHEARLISESRRRMFGADMPANVRVTGEIEHKLDPAVTKMIEESKERIRQQQEATEKSQLEDPAIIDAEIVDDEPDFKEEPYQEFLTDEEESEVEDL